MPSTIGLDVGNLMDRYAINYDEVVKVWRILDLRHPEMTKIQDIDADEIEDSHPALTILTEQMFSKLIQVAVNKGVLNPTIAGLNTANTSGENIDLLKEAIKQQESEISKLKEQLLQKQIQEAVPTMSEKFLLKKLIASNLMKLAISEDLDEIK